MPATPFNSGWIIPPAARQQRHLTTRLYSSRSRVFEAIAAHARVRGGQPSLRRSSRAGSRHRAPPRELIYARLYHQQ